MKSLDDRKRELRGDVLSKRLEISEDEWQTKSEEINAHFTQSDFYKDAVLIHSYVSMNHRNEVDTWNLITAMLADGKKIAVPVTNFMDSSLVHSEINSTKGLVPNKWGIYEPRQMQKVNIQDLDIVVVPMAAADKKGNRLGYGKGFYDRFLSEIEAFKVGFVFNDFIFEEIPAENFDVRMDVIISEKGIIFA
ncbi:MAG: 5-formyltetrahydrofolate cyclo-ligase [Balneolaceae bacterium]